MRLPFRPPKKPKRQESHIRSLREKPKRQGSAEGMSCDCLLGPRRDPNGKVHPLIPAIRLSWFGGFRCFCMVFVVLAVAGRARWGTPCHQILMFFWWFWWFWPLLEMPPGAPNTIRPSCCCRFWWFWWFWLFFCGFGAFGRCW